MVFKNGVFILECVPKRDGRDEGRLIKEFLEFFRYNIEYSNITNKTKFFQKLPNNYHKYVHISSHGVFDEKTTPNDFYILLPKGKIRASEFDENSGLKNKYVILTACDLGKVGFMDPFLTKTKCKAIIAPQRKIEFEDSAIWCLNFYYYLFHNKIDDPEIAFNYMKDQFYIKGAMQYY